MGILFTPLRLQFVLKMFSRNLSQKLKLLNSLRTTQQAFRSYETVKYPTQTGTATYEGDGRTKAIVLNKDVIGNGLMINSISKIGFRLNNDMLVIGPMVLFPR